MKRLLVSIYSLLLCLGARSQQLFPHSTKEKDTMSMVNLPHIFIPATTNTFKNEQAIPQNFYAQHLGFFCRQELKMQEVHVPVTFRLGSMDYCNWLEQKPGYR